MFGRGLPYNAVGGTCTYFVQQLYALHLYIYQLFMYVVSPPAAIPIFICTNVNASLFLDTFVLGLAAPSRCPAQRRDQFPARLSISALQAKLAETNAIVAQ